MIRNTKMVPRQLARYNGGSRHFAEPYSDGATRFEIEWTAVPKG